MVAAGAGHIARARVRGMKSEVRIYRELLSAGGLDHHRLRATAGCLEDVKIGPRGK
jgi:hypothetical protein